LNRIATPANAQVAHCAAEAIDSLRQPMIAELFPVSG
jgi:hypothetical protein